MSDKNKKKKKPKTVYVDDGRTIADMSALGGSRPLGSGMSKRSTGTAKERMQTYLHACKTMLMPMFVTLGIISAAFLILYLLLHLAT